MNDIKVLVKTEKELNILIQLIRIYRQDTGMEFGIKECAMLIMKSGKRERAAGIELLNQENIMLFGEKEN